MEPDMRDEPWWSKLLYIVPPLLLIAFCMAGVIYAWTIYPRTP